MPHLSFVNFRLFWCSRRINEVKQLLLWLSLLQRIPVIWKRRRWAKPTGPAFGRPTCARRPSAGGRGAPKSGLPDLGSQTCRNRQQPISVAPLPTLQAIPTRPGTAIGRLGSWSSRGNHKGRPQREGSPTAGNASFGACYANIAPSNGPALDRSDVKPMPLSIWPACCAS
jgi:hypothetical protein